MSSPIISFSVQCFSHNMYLPHNRREIQNSLRFVLSPVQLKKMNIHIHHTWSQTRINCQIVTLNNIEIVRVEPFFYEITIAREWLAKDLLSLYFEYSRVQLMPIPETFSPLIKSQIFTDPNGKNRLSPWELRQRHLKSSRYWYAH